MVNVLLCHRSFRSNTWTAFRYGSRICHYELFRGQKWSWIFLEIILVCSRKCFFFFLNTVTYIISLLLLNQASINVSSIILSLSVRNNKWVAFSHFRNTILLLDSTSWNPKMIVSIKYISAKEMLNSYLANINIPEMRRCIHTENTVNNTNNADTRAPG